VAGQQEVNQRRDDQAEHHGDGEAANDGDRKRLQHLRACAERKGQRQHAANAATAVMTIGRRRRWAA